MMHNETEIRIKQAAIVIELEEALKAARNGNLYYTRHRIETAKADIDYLICDDFEAASAVSGIGCE